MPATLGPLDPTHRDDNRPGDDLRSSLAGGPIGLLAAAVEAMPQGVVVTDAARADNPIVYCNRGFCQLTGYDPGEILGRNCRFLQGPDTDQVGLQTIRDAVADGRGCVVVLKNYRKDGTPFWNNLTVTPLHDAGGQVTHFVGVQTDITPVKLLEEQLRQSQKMEAVGQLAGGIAHDFNNLLTVINGYAELLQATRPADDPARELAGEILRAGGRAAALTRQLLAFTRSQPTQPVVFDLNGAVAEAERLLRRLLGPVIELRLHLAARPLPVRADPAQIEQVLMNLVVNARDAMPAGGRVTVRTAAADGRVRLTVADTGTGMDPATAARIFDPFFTTKPKGKGTGLGLATVRGIAEAAGGSVRVETTPGRGAAFTVDLPASDAPPAAGSGDRPPPRGTEIVLAVDDDDDVRAVVRVTLQRYGYTVREATTGPEALAASRDGVVQLVVTDLLMPGMTGRELGERLAEARPGLPVLYLSGYAETDWLPDGVADGRTPFLAKPFPPEALARKVREVLDAARPGPSPAPGRNSAAALNALYTSG